MYLRPASWAQATLSSKLWRVRTLASLMSIGRFRPAITSALVCSITEMARFEGVPPNMSVSRITPSNLAISVMEQTKAEVIAGLNLPMLIKLASVRQREDLQACVAHAQEAGRKYISVASYVLAGEK